MSVLPTVIVVPIRCVDRDGVIIKRVPVNDETCQAMYDLFKETADGAGFTIRSPQYYREFYQSCVLHSAV